jgi:hypothetical protein
VRIADRENTGGDGRFRRLTIACRRHPRGRRARRTGAMIRDADQDRVDQPPLAFVWHVSAQQERDDVGVRAACHQRHEIVTANDDALAVGVGNRRAPALRYPPR